MRLIYKYAKYIGKFLLKPIGYYGLLFVVMYAFFPSVIKLRVSEIAAS